MVLLVTVVAMATLVVFDAGAAQRLKKVQERKFPSQWCPLNTGFLGSFTSETGHIKITFITINGYDDGSSFAFFNNRLDDVVVMEASEFVPPNTRDSDCYSDEIVPELDPSYPLVSNPAVPFYEPFDPPMSPCSWDESSGATINDTDGWIELGSAGLGEVFVETSVIISGLTIDVPYVIWGQWHAIDFFDDPACTPGALCMEITVDDLAQGCLVPTEDTTWGGIKSLYDR
jgi:hypothetical protein